MTKPVAVAPAPTARCEADPAQPTPRAGTMKTRSRSTPGSDARPCRRHDDPAAAGGAEILRLRPVANASAESATPEAQRPSTNVVMLTVPTRCGDVSLIVNDESPWRAEAISRMCREVLERELSRLRPGSDP